MVRWMLFSTLAAGVFYGLYCLLLRRDRWLQLARAYLILTLAFSLAYPLVRLPVRVAPITVTYMLPEVTVGEASAVQEANPASTGALPWLPMAIYLIGEAATLAVLAVQITTISRRMSGERVTLLDDETAPCSFFNHIIIGTRGMSHEEQQLVLAHEEEHVRRHHTEEVLLMRLLCCVAWFNPFAWLMLRELRAVHEYQADAAAIGNGRIMIRPYMQLLYQQVTGTGYGHITNKFNSINIKNRIVMMNKKKTRFGAWKALVALPVAALLLMVGCKPAATSTEPETTEPQVQEVVTTMDSVYEAVEVEPEFEGGIEGLYKYMAQNIHYPEQAKADNIQGRVMVRFVVEADGSVSNAEVVRGIGGGCDEEALRVVQSMPNWKPGMVKGEAVRVNYNIPITFQLQ